MPRAVGITNIAVIFRALIGVFNHQRNRGTGSDLFRRAIIRKDAREDFDLIRLAPLRGEARLPRLAAIKLDLNISFRQRDQRRAAIDDAANRNPVAFAKGSDAEKMAETVVRHRYRFRMTRFFYKRWPNGSNPAASHTQRHPPASNTKTRPCHTSCCGAVSVVIPPIIAISARATPPCETITLSTVIVSIHGFSLLASIA